MKTKGTKKIVIKRNRRFEDYKNCSDAAQTENKVNHLEKNKIDLDGFKEDQKDFMKNTKLILKTKQKSESEIHSVFTEKIKNITLSSNDDRRI